MKTKFIIAIAIVLFVAGLVAFDVYRNSPMIQNPELFKKK
jgi:flagellar biosynthesis/type III secretory pathway M-ring protein FliF/YscJ